MASYVRWNRYLTGSRTWPGNALEKSTAVATVPVPTNWHVVAALPLCETRDPNRNPKASRYTAGSTVAPKVAERQ